MKEGEGVAGFRRSGRKLNSDSFENGDRRMHICRGVIIPVVRAVK